MMKFFSVLVTFAIAIYGIWVIVAAQRKSSRPAQQYQLWLLVGGIMILCQVLFKSDRLLGVVLLFAGCVVVSIINYLIDRGEHGTVNWRNHSLRALLELVLVVWAALAG
ncbi:hypothetical protein ACRYI5_08235 [Furfurilactobacillus sp. WILCCON 0119]|uniref:hypothetical protein n=1 Tax=Furfurilactobacillus entadae TaxID=2922307 RepID=UPI0035E51BE9